MEKIRQFIETHSEGILIAVVLILSGILHAWNMFHFPYFENDEGTYMAQAWSFLHGKLAPYTYWYDHAPVGWIFTSLWILITGGLFSFGFSLNSGRVFMLILHLCSTFLLFKTTGKMTKSNLAAAIACIFFSASPLGIYFQRRLLLDNIMTFWVLLSLFLILYSNKNLWVFIGSAITFAIGILSKEDAIFFLPVFLGLVTVEAHKHNRIFAVSKWLLITCMIISLYPLYALFKKELFPVGSFLSPPYPHVSLIGSLQLQAGRGTGLPAWNPKSDFMTNMHFWITQDPLLIIGGFVCLGIQGIIGIFRKANRLIFFLTLSILAFLTSGKLVINFYMLPLLPFLGMCIGAVFADMTNIVRRAAIRLSPAAGVIVSSVLMIACIGFLSFYYYNNHFLSDVLTHDETTVQLQAIDWIKKNVPPQDFISIDYYGNLDLSNSRYPGDPIFPNANWYWKVAFDPAISGSILHNDSNNITYTLMTAQMYRDQYSYPNDSSILQKSLKNSTLIKSFNTDDYNGKSLTAYAQSHPNGNWLMLYKQNTPEDNLAESWNNYKQTFITPSGETIDTTNTITSKNQSYTLLKAVWMNDRQTFDKVSNWTMNHMELPQTALFATAYIPGKGVTNNGTTTSADGNIALALLLAHHTWQSEAYLDRAKKIIDAIWKNETVTIQKKQYIVAGSWTSQSEAKQYMINMSDVMPSAFRLFEMTNPQHNWGQLITTSYQTLLACTNATLDGQTSTGIPPNWCTLDANGKVSDADSIAKDSTMYGEDAMQAIWNIALDNLWFKDPRDKAYLTNMTLWQEQWKSQGAIYAMYTHNGLPLTTDQSMVNYGTQLAYFAAIEPSIAKQIYDKYLSKQYTISNGRSYWGEQHDISIQNWVWFGYGFYTKQIPSYTK